MSQRNISDLESGKTRPRTDLVAKIAKVVDCPVEELLAWGPGTAAGSAPGAPSSQFVLPLRGTEPFARFCWPERIGSPVQLVAVPEELYEGQRVVLRAGDDSMAPEIRLHDLCIFDPALSPAHGSIVCAQVGADPGSCTVRWFLDTDDAIVLAPEDLRSTEAEPIVLVRQRGGVYRYLGQPIQLAIKGVLVGVIRSYALPG